MSDQTEKRRPGRPTEPNSLRETAKREGKTLWQVRKERGEFRRPNGSIPFRATSG